MTGRTTLAPDRIQLAHRPVNVTDKQVDETVNAYEAIARGTYKRDRIDTVAPAGETWEINRPEVVHAASPALLWSLARSTSHATSTVLMPVSSAGRRCTRSAASAWPGRR